MASPFESSQGSRIADLRKHIGRQRGKRLTQRELAEKIGVARETVVAWEADLQQPSAENVARMATFLGTTPEYLIFGTTSPETPEESAVSLPRTETAPRSNFPHRTVGERIEARRHQLWLESGEAVSQPRLARRIGVHPRTVEAWEKGRHLPSRRYLPRLMHELKISADELFRGVEVPAELLQAREPSEAFQDEAEPPIQYEGKYSSGRVPSPWTRTAVTFYHEELARLDEWRHFYEPWNGPEVRRTDIIRALVEGLLDSNVSLEDVGWDVHKLRTWVTHGLGAVKEGGA
jgi:transcriptional regulator with XRE-family HTH domain